MSKLAIVLGAAALALTTTASRAHAFCGFYVNGSGGKMFNDATQVVLMREGTRTVLSMQNDFAGPLTDFAMVVPVPVVLHEGDVKTLPKVVFDHVDSLGSPRLVEYWEQDPCPRPVERRAYEGAMPSASMAAPGDAAGRGVDKSSVKIEAQFAVGEYQILILSATDSTGLETWLRDNHYKIPDGAEPLLRPYVESNMKFFVAKVDPKKVAMVNGHAALSPLRFHYDSEDFALPIRLGMANSSGTQDLIVNILSGDKRYEVANYGNVTIPTNIDVRDSVKSRFGEFYAALFDRTIQTHPHSVVTEYAWTARPNYHCDPCAALDVDQADLMSLGGDVIGGPIASGNFVLTRLHARYSKADMKDDLRFRQASAIVGGRESLTSNGELEHGAVASSENYFQGRYAIRHAWTGPIACKNPQRGIWGGPPDGSYQQAIAATKSAFAPRGRLALADVVRRDIPEVKVWLQPASTAPPGQHFAQPPAGGNGKTMDFGAGVLIGMLLIGAGRRVARRGGEPNA